jgi:hypothetical protein
MKNFPNQEIDTIKSKIDNNISKIFDAINWVDSNLKYETKNKLNLKFKNTVNTLKKINKNIHSKPVMAVFGASQVGKSYLIKNLLSDTQKPFYINNGEIKYDFLKDINPPGTGAESTGVVTRFTIDNEIKFLDFPIKVKLLKPKDIFIIILDTYFLDSKKISKTYDKIRLEEHIIHYEELTKNNPIQSFLTEFEILEIKEYFNNHLSKHSIVFENLNDTRFFERIATLIERSSVSNWVAIFEVLWNKNEAISKLATTLIHNLNQIEFAENIYLSFNEVLREGGNQILDVQRINQLYADSKTTTFKKDNGETFSLQLSFIAALIEELVFNIPRELAENKPFLNNSDLLDFPGARSRKTLEFDEITDNLIPEMLLRGKVSYLFNKYSDDFNINNLLFCTNDSKLEVNELPSLLNNWLNRNIGENPVERNKALQNAEIPSLFVIYSFFNNQLKFDTTNDIDFDVIPNKLEYKWNTRFNTFFENEIVTPTRNWHKEWTNEKPNFNNFYLLRDYKYSNDTYIGFEQYGKETEFNEQRRNYFKELEKSFLNHNFVQNHFQNPIESWKNATDINSDGTNLIIQNLNKVSNNASKINRYIHKHDLLINEVISILKEHLHTDDLSEIREKNTKNVNTLLFSFNELLSKDIHGFNTFISELSLNVIDVYNFLIDHIHIDLGTENSNELDSSNILVIQNPELKNVSTLEEAIAILKKALWLSSDKDVLEILASNNINKDVFIKSATSKTRAQYYVDLLLDYWRNYLEKNELEKFSYFITSGVSKESLHFLIEFYFRLVAQRGIKVKLEYIINDITSDTENNRGVEEFLAELFTIIINEIVFNFDNSYFTTDEINEINKLNYNFKFFNVQKENETNHIRSLFEDNKELADVNQVVLEKYNKWIETLRISLLINSGFVDYDEDANIQLKNLVSNFNTIEI